MAHEDYSQHSRIIVAEKLDRLIFSNAGRFFEGNPEDYTGGDKTPERYRNPWLANAMVNLSMIDTLGYGIHIMYIEQRKRYFPLSDYLLSETQKVVLQIYGHSIDGNYSKLLIERKDLPLSQVVLLDRVQKKLPIVAPAASLKKEGLIEGRKPNFFVAASVAAVTDNKAFDDDHYKKMIKAYIEKYTFATRKELEELILDKLSDTLSDKQKRNKVGNLISSLRVKGIIENKGSLAKPIWVKRV